MTNTYQNFLALRRMVFGHLRLLAIFVGVTFIVDHWRSSGGHDTAQGYANGQVAYLASGGPAFVPLSPATLLNKMHKDASFDVGMPSARSSNRSMIANAAKCLNPT